MMAVLSEDIPRAGAFGLPKGQGVMVLLALALVLSLGKAFGVADEYLKLKNVLDASRKGLHFLLEHFNARRILPAVAKGYAAGFEHCVKYQMTTARTKGK